MSWLDDYDKWFLWETSNEDQEQAEKEREKALKTGSEEDSDTYPQS